jgi:hypothetical protein
MSDENVLVRCGRAVATIHRHDSDLYTHEKCDLDVLNREGELAAATAASETDPLRDAKALFDFLTYLHQIKFDDKQPRLTDEELWGIKFKILKYHVLWD